MGHESQMAKLAELEDTQLVDSFIGFVISQIKIQLKKKSIRIHMQEERLRLP